MKFHYPWCCNQRQINIHLSLMNNLYVRNIYPFNLQSLITLVIIWFVKYHRTVIECNVLFRNFLHYFLIFFQKSTNQIRYYDFINFHVHSSLNAPCFRFNIRSIWFNYVRYFWSYSKRRLFVMPTTLYPLETYFSLLVFSFLFLY